MNLSPGVTPKTFNLLSIGQRAVGKTVFLAGSYAELHSYHQPGLPQRLWFDCQDSQVQEKIERILNYMTQTSQYPPPTMRITDFNFSLKRHDLWGTQTLCNFSWWDIPGESCNADNPDFRRIVSNSHGCCVFIDAFKLVNDRAYVQALEEDIILQVRVLADLVSLNGLKYAFALILTKYDQLKPNPLNQQQITEGLRSLTTHLDTLKVNYQTFYSAISIVLTKGASTLEVEGAAAAFLWLVSELSQTHNPRLINNPVKLVARLLPNRSQPQDSVDGLTQSLRGVPSRALGVKELLGLLKLRLRLLPTPHRYLLILALVFVSSLGLIGTLFLDYKWVYQRQPNSFDTLSQSEPEHIKLRLQLAQSYETIGQVAEAETLYNEVLAEQKNNLSALVSKAALRNAQGDTKTAETLFAQAEKAAPADLKARVRAVAQETLSDTH
jgi:tetratricopeptide (TPR) repeat protein